MTNTAKIHECAHLLAGPIARGERELTNEEREHLVSAYVYLYGLLGYNFRNIHSEAMSDDAMSTWLHWRELGSSADRDDQAHDSAALGQAQGTRRG